MILWQGRFRAARRPPRRRTDSRPRLSSPVWAELERLLQVGEDRVEARLGDRVPAVPEDHWAVDRQGHPGDGHERVGHVDVHQPAVGVGRVDDLASLVRALAPLQPDGLRVASDAQDDVLGILQGVADALLAVDGDLVGRQAVELGARLGQDRLQGRLGGRGRVVGQQRRGGRGGLRGRLGLLVTPRSAPLLGLRGRSRCDVRGERGGRARDRRRVGGRRGHHWRLERHP